MAVKIKNTGDLNEEKWNSLLEHAPHSTVYHTKTWSEVWEKSYPGSHSFFLICVDEKGDYLAGFPVWQRERFGLKSFFSMPFGTYGGLVTKKDQHENSFLSIYEELKRMFQGVNTLGAHIVDFFCADRYLEDMGFSCTRHNTHLIHLDRIDENDYMKFFAKKRREGIRQSRRRRVKVREVGSSEDTKRCYQLLLDTWQRHDLKSAKYPAVLFDNIFLLMGKSSLLKWFVALMDEKIIGSLVNFVFKDTLYAWEMGADFKELNARPNDALFMESILWAKKNGLKFFNFGATPEAAEGMTRFKESWGAEKREYLIFEKKKRLGRIVEKMRRVS